MSGLLLVPYNDSMRLGQGYNSFLHTPCVHGAVNVDDDDTEVVQNPGSVPQVVSYSSRFVDKISEVVRSMNISAGTSIKSGTIIASGNSLNVDETKFTASDLNAVVSVKVVNQQTKLRDDAVFVAPKFAMTSSQFHSYYGDSYISGFIEGGDLHGIVCVKALDASKKDKIKSVLKGEINGSGNGEFTLSKSGGSSSVSSALKQTETTISVNWSGGGQIKQENEEWSYESLMRAAAAFPAKVASCPQKTYAILTKYDSNIHFLAYAQKTGIKIRDYAIAQRYTSDLLDMYMGYKNNLARIQDVLSNPAMYRISNVANPLSIITEDLIKERQAMKMQMAEIVDQIDDIDRMPEKVYKIEAKSTIEPPEVWATRLPVHKDEDRSTSNAATTTSFTTLMQSFPFAVPPAPAAAAAPASAPALTPSLNPPAPSTTIENMNQIQRQTQFVIEKRIIVEKVSDPSISAISYELLSPPPIFDESTIGPRLLPSERALLSDHTNRYKFQHYRFGSPQGSPEEGESPFNDCEQLEAAVIPQTWPTRIEVQMVSWSTHSIVGLITTTYEQVQLTHGSNKCRVVDTLTLNLEYGEKICKIRMSSGPRTWNVNGISYIEFMTTTGNRWSIGNENGDTIECSPYDGTTGLKGFFGRNGDVVDRMGPIWGSDQLLAVF